ncbi:hypothetical protein HPP92_003499 [Vanilla planifolia]|uniref:Uncharacterized protein n=1 Tax=Vanilla planifolia TaxID=51239 RepID=A0A835RXQ9_VANPL|nr:hypothetical protein HPP92_003499 [Vanilla planifolia]
MEEPRSFTSKPQHRHIPEANCCVYGSAIYEQGEFSSKNLTKVAVLMDEGCPEYYERGVCDKSLPTVIVGDFNVGMA